MDPRYPRAVRTAGTFVARSTLVAGLCLALLALAATNAPAKPKRGIDVSRFQGEIDWERVGRTNVEFAWVQASRGEGDDCAVVPDRCGPDEFYAANYAGATQAGIRVGAYHRAFAGGGSRKATTRDARREAKVFIGEVGELRDGDLLPALDVETPFGGLSEKGLRRWIRAWLDRVRRELGAKPLIYTNQSSWQATGDTRRFARQGHPLWVANFGVDSPAVPAGNWDGQGWSVWQYTSSGSVDGIKGAVDRDRMRVGWDQVSAP
jgi:GH25 family lysozyme M1 (1,4-beta-N-acetylmuramidase)